MVKNKLKTGTKNTTFACKKYHKHHRDSKNKSKNSLN